MRHKIEATYATVREKLSSSWFIINGFATPVRLDGASNDGLCLGK